MTITLLSVIVFFAIGFSKLCDGVGDRFRQNATIFPASLASLYFTYLSWSALSSMPDEECNPLFYSNTNTIMQIVVGSIFTFITVASIATASKSNADKNEPLKMAAENVVAEDVDGDADNKDMTGIGNQTAEESAIFPVTLATVIFQLIMLLMVLYYGMLFTNWMGP